MPDQGGPNELKQLEELATHIETLHKEKRVVRVGLMHAYAIRAVLQTVRDQKERLDAVEREAREAGRKACERKWQRAMADVSRAEKLRRG